MAEHAAALIFGVCSSRIYVRGWEGEGARWLRDRRRDRLEEQGTPPSPLHPDGGRSDRQWAAASKGGFGEKTVRGVVPVTDYFRRGGEI
jgi:hypothetical protein